MPYNFSKDEPCDPESLSWEDWRFLRALNVFGLLLGLVPLVIVEIQKNEPHFIFDLLFGLAWVAFFAQNIMRATAWMRSAQRKDTKNNDPR